MWQVYSLKMQRVLLWFMVLLIMAGCLTMSLSSTLGWGRAPQYIGGISAVVSAVCVVVEMARTRSPLTTAIGAVPPPSKS